MTNTATFLGTGSSLGVPVIGCPCAVCSSTNPKNKRFRSSILLNYEGKRIVIDAGPDFRSQALNAKLDHLDGVIFTHSHQDHSAGIDDLRIYSFRNKAPFPCLVSRETAKDLELRYFFMFKMQPNEPTKTKRLHLNVLEEREGNTEFLGIPIRYFSYEQIGMQVLGIRIGSFAYVTDIKNYDEAILKELDGVNTLVLSALRFTESHMHLTVDEAIDFAEKTHAKHCYLTHISHEIEHEKVSAYLPSTIKLSYDGLQIFI